MEIDRNRVQELVSDPRESLSCEVKRWIDPTRPENIAKIVRATFALYNRNGGELVIGFDNTSLKPDTPNVPNDVRRVFHGDVIQAIVSKYASKPFEVGVGYGTRDGREYPVIVVPPGVQAPVAVKKSISDPNNKFLVAVGDVYFRSLYANGVVSSAKALPEDWPEIIQICSSNIQRRGIMGDTTIGRRCILSFDRNGLENFWYTFDADDNRNVREHQQKGRWSFSIFRISPRMISEFESTIHSADIYVYHGSLQRWVELENRAQVGFPGPQVQGAVCRFQDENAQFTPLRVPAHSATALSVPKVGIFNSALSAEFVFESKLWGDANNSYYACLTIVFHFNTRYLSLMCLVPEFTHRPMRSYFVGRPIVSDVNDKERILEENKHRLRDLEELPKRERISFFWKFG